MTLRKKTLLIVGLTLGVLFIGLIVASWTIVLGGFEDQESQDTRTNVERVLGALDDDLRQLEVTTRDWAEWNDTYQYMEDRNEAYIESNWVDGTLAVIGMNVALYVDTAGQVVLSKAYDLAADEVAAVPDSLLEHLSSEQLLLAAPVPGDGVVGLISLPEGPMLVASRPILTGGGEGPVRGHLIFGQYLDAAGVEKLSRTTLISLDSIPVDGTQMTPEHRDVLAGLSLESPILVQPLSSDVVVGYALVPDIYGEPALLLEAEMARGVYQRGQVTVLYFTIALIVIGIIFGVVILVLLEKLVLSRLARLAGEVNAIGLSADSSAQVSISGNDELAQLGNEINAMLCALEKSQDELRKSEQALRETQKSLVQAEKLSSIGQLVAGVAHELNNPLTAVMGYSQLLVNLDLEPKVKEYVDRIRTGAERSRRIVQNLLTFAGRRELHLSKLDLNQEIENALKFLDNELTEGHIQVSLDLAPGLPWMEGDSSQLQSVLTNLINNAQNAMIQQQVSRTLLIKTGKLDHHLRLSIADNGPGIDPQHLNKIFDPFFTTKEVGAGTGLGLSLCHGIVSDHHGRIWAESDPGRGATFIIEFPTDASGDQPIKVLESSVVG